MADHALMPCYNPTRVVLDGDHRANFKRDWRWAKYSNNETVVNLPCRKCLGCRQAQTRDWSIRSFHEALLTSEHWTDQDSNITTKIPNSSVITLTYDEEHLPRTFVDKNLHEHQADTGFLVHDDFQRFMKRLRHWRKRKLGITTPVRYLMCGEFGGQTSRPHFHAIIFNHLFADCYEETTKQTRSQELDYLWSQPIPGEYFATTIGRATVDTFSWAGAAYVAGYVAKKSAINGHQGPRYETVDEHGVYRCAPITPEYHKASTHPGLGAEWLLKPHNLAQVYSDDAIKIAQYTFHPPKYYDKLLADFRPDLVGQVKRNRFNEISRAVEDWDPARCASAELIALADLQQRRDSL